MATRQGPHIKAECSGCRGFRMESYRVQGDSGYDAYCDEMGGKNIGDTMVKTPDWCPFLSNALAAAAAMK